MKTLDEVIDAMERCSMPHMFMCEDCPYEDEECGCWSDQRDADVLHYLKEHKNQQDFYDQSIKRTTDMIDKCEKTVAEYLSVNNPPLTWDELKTMEGKPIWVMESAEHGMWWTYWIVWNEKETTLSCDSYGTTWKAYRKERK